MTRFAWLGAVLLLGLPCLSARAGVLARPTQLEKANSRLAGRVVDYTHNNGADRRLWSPALGEYRDLYVYLPPGFDCSRQYPIMLWLNGFEQDEQAFLKLGIVEMLDDAIVAGQLPPLIVAAPDGSLKGRPSYLQAGSFYVNSKAGNFQDYILHDVWGFMLAHYPIRPEREAHVIAGVSMGGFGAFNLAIKRPDLFKVVLGVFPPLNLRWQDCHGRYLANFDPCCWGWRTRLGLGWQPVAKFLGGVIKVRAKKLVNPLFGLGPDALVALSRENPIEMLTTYGIRPGELDMYIAYAGKDQFNIDAQVESFLYRARQLCLNVAVGYAPKGKHSLRTAKELFPGIVEWLGDRLAPYAPCPGTP